MTVDRMTLVLYNISVSFDTLLMEAHMVNNIKKVLAKCRLFEGCSPSLLDTVLKKSVVRDFEFGDLILSNTSESKNIGVLVSGSAFVHSHDGGKSVLLRKLYAGDLFGVATLFDSENKSISHITAGKSCRVLLIKSESVRFLLENDNEFMYSYISFLSERIKFLNRKILYYTAGSAERRLALYLMSFNADTVLPDLPMNALAELLDMGRASLYRAFDRLTEDGFITRNENIINIIDREKMIKFYNI